MTHAVVHHALWHTFLPTNLQMRRKVSNFDRRCLKAMNCFVQILILILDHNYHEVFAEMVYTRDGSRVVTQISWSWGLVKVSWHLLFVFKVSPGPKNKSLETTYWWWSAQKLYKSSRSPKSRVKKRYRKWRPRILFGGLSLEDLGKRAWLLTKGYCRAKEICQRLFYFLFVINTKLWPHRQHQTLSRSTHLPPPTSTNRSFKTATIIIPQIL